MNSFADRKRAPKISPHKTEKTTELNLKNQYTFKIPKNFGKNNFKKHIEKFYNVQVASINVLNVAGKERRFGKIIGRKSDWKKAYVTLKEGFSINTESDIEKG